VAPLVRCFILENQEATVGGDIVHGGNRVDGKFVMRDRKILTVDEGSTSPKPTKVGRRIWSQVEAASPVRVPRPPRS
jgi:hypothetical protein